MNFFARVMPFALCSTAAFAIDCARELTASEKVARMNAALTPVLKTLGARLRELPAKEVEGLATTIDLDRRELLLADQLSPAEKALGVYESFAGWIRYSHSSTLQGPYSPYNLRIMLRLTLAVTLVEALIERWVEDLRAEASFRAELELMREESATGEDLEFLLKLACQTILQGLSALTASSLPDIEAERLLECVARGRRCRPSTINQYALALTAGQLGGNGDLVYVVDPLILDNGIPRFSPKSRALMKTARAQFDRGTACTGEFGKGCPVAHTLDGFERTGVQELVDGILHVYDRI